MSDLAPWRVYVRRIGEDGAEMKLFSSPMGWVAEFVVGVQGFEIARAEHGHRALSRPVMPHEDAEARAHCEGIARQFEKAMRYAGAPPPSVPTPPAPPLPPPEEPPP